MEEEGEGNPGQQKQVYLLNWKRPLSPPPSPSETEKKVPHIHNSSKPPWLIWRKKATARAPRGQIPAGQPCASLSLCDFFPSSSPEAAVCERWQYFISYVARSLSLHNLVLSLCEAYCYTRPRDRYFVTLLIARSPRVCIHTQFLPPSRERALLCVQSKLGHERILSRRRRRRPLRKNLCVLCGNNRISSRSRSKVRGNHKSRMLLLAE